MVILNQFTGSAFSDSLPGMKHDLNGFPAPGKLDPFVDFIGEYRRKRFAKACRIERDVVRYLVDTAAADLFAGYCDILGKTAGSGKLCNGRVRAVLAVSADTFIAFHTVGVGEEEEAVSDLILRLIRSNLIDQSYDLMSVCAIDGMPWVFDAPIQTSGAALKWFISRRWRQRNAPLWNEYARGMFIGMGMDMKRSALVRSVFEGTAYALRHVMETVKESGAKAKILKICGSDHI